MTLDGGVLALIPARGGSKGVPRKNVADLGGRPLIAWTIEAAIESGCTDRVIVSTDDDEIADAALAAGAEVPFRRPESLATDEATPVDVALHALDWVREDAGQEPRWTMLLQATSPLRNAGDVRAAVELASQPETDSAVAVREVHDHPAWLLRRTPDGHLVPASASDAMRRQDEPELLVPNGALYLVQSAVLRSRRGWYGAHARPLVMPEERSIDIDTPWDLELVRLIVGSRPID